jgi:hypothetical protein
MKRPAVVECIRNCTPARPHQWAKVEKHRSQVYYDNLAIEETHINLVLQRGEGEGTHESSWLSYCIEGDDLDKVNAAAAAWLQESSEPEPGADADFKRAQESKPSGLQQQTLVVLGVEAIVGGYPTWLTRILQHL